jgi:uncharacterized protein (DUF2237 family)
MSESGLTGLKNILGTELKSCSFDPLTGFFRDGCCRTRQDDMGSHVVCAVVTKEFLEFSKAAGNDLSTPRLEFNFPGLMPGDQWCLCASRWREALDAGCAPAVVLEATHAKALEFATLADFKYHEYVG